MDITINNKKVRLKIIIYGLVQGVGFRPFIYKLASKLDLNGFIKNSNSGVFIEIEGAKKQIELFLDKLEKEKPRNANIYYFEKSFLESVEYKNFSILKSDEEGEMNTFILPDIATCLECLDEMFDRNNRRYLYPFTNCTNCGPRFSIIEKAPYDRENTTMKDFQMCKSCYVEYHNPQDRRFHAQTNTCSNCGPNFKLLDRYGNLILNSESSINKSIDLIRSGNIIAVKGLGGFHLIADAKNNQTVAELRIRKNRKEKPFALMFPSIEEIKKTCFVSKLEENLLLSKECPIVFLKRKGGNNLPDSVSPNNPYLGVMLPYTPLQHIMMKELNFPVIATSGNISNEPICINEEEAKERLKKIADYFLTHNQRISHPLDDSIVRIVANKETIIRRSRGYTPTPIFLKNNLPNILAVGGHLKNTISISNGHKVFISQHIGSLENYQSYKIFENTIKSFKNLFNITPSYIACDIHPDYLSTKYAYKEDKNAFQIQHHHAHILSCMAENKIDYPFLGIAWDGTGLGLDKTIWGSEFILAKKNDLKRIAYFSHIKLPGGEKAIKEPRRTALGLLYDVFEDELFEMKDLPTIKAFSKKELKILKSLLKKDINCVPTASVGRLFDAVSSILGLKQFINFEGQAAMELEFLAETFETNKYYSFELIDNHASEPTIISWSKIIHEIMNDMKNNVLLSEISSKFHNTLVEIIVRVAKNVNLEKVVLTGGCFQNKYLTERSIHRLNKEGFQTYFHQKVPPNDGGISLGQIIRASEIIQRG